MILFLFLFFHWQSGGREKRGGNREFGLGRGKCVPGGLRIKDARIKNY